MGTAGMRPFHGLDPADVADELDRLYCPRRTHYLVSREDR